MFEVISSVPAVTATLVSVEDRMDFLPAMFPRCFVLGESMVFRWMENLSLDYKGGFWEFYRLSNGGFYMAPRTEAKAFWLEVDGNGFSDSVSADAAGIIACLFALCYMAHRTEDDAVIDNYHYLREYISHHPEAVKIWRAID